MATKKIKFYPWERKGIYEAGDPRPAARSIPSWMTSLPRYLSGDQKPRILDEGQTNMTVKSCPPFLDSLISGYTISLPSDVFVEKNAKGSVDFRWRAGLEMVAGHSPDQISDKQVSDEYLSEPFKWINYWSVELPRGYSGLFVHPLNRTDLPFHTLSGLVDLDSYRLPVHFPFLLKNNFEGVIPAGTPIVQIIPIKRENWNHEKMQFDEKIKDYEHSKFFSFVFGAYKKAYWNRKHYR